MIGEMGGGPAGDMAGKRCAAELYSILGKFQ